MDVETLGKKFRGKVTFWGDLDRQHTMIHPNVDVVIAEGKKLIDNFWTSKGGFIGMGEWSADVPVENIEAMQKVWLGLL